MLAILRVLFGFALFAVFGKAVEVAGPTAQTEGTTDAGYLALAVIIGIANAVVWAPWVGRWMADPLTGAFTAGHPADFTNSTLQLAHKLALRRWRRSALFFAFLEGVRHPDLPGAFVLGMGQARSGSWLEKVFAKEVWRFENAENCLRAWKILQRHGVEPDMHRKPEVHLLILAQRREVPPTPEVLVVRPAPPAPKPVRNPGIRIFDGAGPRIVATPADDVGTDDGVEQAAGEGVAAMPEVGGDPVAPPEGTVLFEAKSAPGSNAPGADESKDVAAPKVRLKQAASSAVPGRRTLGWRERVKVLWTGRVED